MSGVLFQVFPNSVGDGGGGLIFLRFFSYLFVLGLVSVAVVARFVGLLALDFLHPELVVAAGARLEMTSIARVIVGSLVYCHRRLFLVWGELFSLRISTVILWTRSLPNNLVVGLLLAVMLLSLLISACARV